MLNIANLQNYILFILHIKLPFHQSFKNFVRHGESKLVERPAELFNGNVPVTVSIHRFKRSEQKLNLVLYLRRVVHDSTYILYRTSEK